MKTSEEIKRRLWNGANELRGSMDASRYKDYMLGLMFYKFLSDNTLETFKNINKMKGCTEEEVRKTYTETADKMGDQLFRMIKMALGYYVAPEYLYQTWLYDIETGEFEVQKVTDSLNYFERSIAVTEENDDFKGLFSSSTLDLSDTALGSNLNDRSKNIKALIQLFADMNMVELGDGDVLGDAYEYLIGMFAMESGKKAGEFYTPSQVSEVMAQIIARSNTVESIYDPTVGSGSLLLTVRKHLDEDAQKNLEYFGQEKNTSTYNLTRMNLLLHGVRPEKMEIKNGDSLAEDWPEDPRRPSEGVLFDAVVMNPPYSLKNWNRSELKVSDPRFEVAGVLPPDSKGDFAFLLHGLYHLRQSGTMAIVLPHGVLFRGASEGEIRKRLLEKNYIDTVMGLPSNLFTNTGIPVVVMILKKNRKLDEPVLIIDASNDFVKVGKQNTLQEKDIAKIVDVYLNRTEIKGYSHLAFREEIVENEYNLNIPRYIESIDEEIPHDVDAHLYGGIPKRHIEELKILQSTAPDVLENGLEEIRDGYVKLVKSIDELTEDILNDDKVLLKSKDIESKVNLFIKKHWEKLKNIEDKASSVQLSKDMLDEVKDILSEFKYIEVYDGYQIVAEIWNKYLSRDTELIVEGEFYTLARSREPNMVTKGSGRNKRVEQDGWTGCLIPNELIETSLYSEELKEIENKRNESDEIEAELSELIESAKEEDTDENIALYDALRKNDEDEPMDSFDNRALKEELKNAEKGSMEKKLLSKVDNLLKKRTKVNREIRESEKEINELVQERILTLTDDEIDELMYEKWFGDTISKMINLVEIPLKEELDIIKMLDERYSETISDMDEQIAELETAFEDLVSQLVVTE